MEYYSGFLVPVKLTSPTVHRPCKDARRTKKSMQKELGGLDQRLRSIEGRLVQNRSRCGSVTARPAKPVEERSPRV